MVVENVAGAEIIPATGVVDQTGWIPGLEEIRDSNGIILTPTFIENDPHHDAGMIAVSVYHGLHFFLDLSGLVRRPPMIVELLLFCIIMWGARCVISAGSL